MGTSSFGLSGESDYALYRESKDCGCLCDHPAGPFAQKEIRPLNEGHQEIDPFLFQNDDGKLYLYHVRKDSGNHIYVVEMEDDLSGVKEGTLKHCISVQNGGARLLTPLDFGSH